MHISHETRTPARTYTHALAHKRTHARVWTYAPPLCPAASEELATPEIREPQQSQRGRVGEGSMWRVGRSRVTQRKQAGKKLHLATLQIHHHATLHKRGLIYIPGTHTQSEPMAVWRTFWKVNHEACRSTRQCLLFYFKYIFQNNFHWRSGDEKPCPAWQWGTLPPTLLQISAWLCAFAAQGCKNNNLMIQVLFIKKKWAGFFFPPPQLISNK